MGQPGDPHSDLQLRVDDRDPPALSPSPLGSWASEMSPAGVETGQPWPPLCDHVSPMAMPAPNIKNQGGEGQLGVLP